MTDFDQPPETVAAGLQTLADGSIDLAFADPPFNIGYDYDVYQDNLQNDEHLNWTRQWMSEVKRVLKDDGSFWLAIGDEYAAELKVMLQRELGFACRSGSSGITHSENCTKKSIAHMLICSTW